MAAANKGVVRFLKQVEYKRLMERHSHGYAKARSIHRPRCTGRRTPRYHYGARDHMGRRPQTDPELIRYINNLNLFSHIYVDPFLLSTPAHCGILSKSTCYNLPHQGDNIYHNFAVYVPQPGYGQPCWNPKLQHPCYSSWCDPSELPSLLASPRIIFNYDIDIFGGVGKIHKSSAYDEHCLFLHEGSYEAIQEYNSNKTQHEQHLYLDHALRGAFQFVAGYEFVRIVFKASDGLLDESQTYEAIVFGLPVRMASRKLVLFRKYNGAKNLPTPLNGVVGEICECAFPWADPMITYAGCFAVAEYNDKNEMLEIERVVRATTQVISATSEVTRVYNIVRLEFEAVLLKSGELKSYEAILLVHEHDSKKMELVFMRLKSNLVE